MALLTPKRYIPLKTYSMDSVPLGLPLGAEYIVDDPPGSTKRWIKICLDSRGERCPMHHRIGAPARIGSNGSEWWLIEGSLHRLDGPARIDDVNIFTSSRYEWWIRGRRIKSFQNFQQITGCSDAEIIVFKLKYGDISQ